MNFNQNSIEAFDDGLYTPEVGPWAENKYKILHHYNHMFATGMKNRFHNRVYIDLFSSAGIAKIRDTNRFVLTSSLIAMNLPDPTIFIVILTKNVSRHYHKELKNTSLVKKQIIF